MRAHHREPLPQRLRGPSHITNRIAATARNDVNSSQTLSLRPLHGCGPLFLTRQTAALLGISYGSLIIELITTAFVPALSVLGMTFATANLIVLSRLVRRFRRDALARAGQPARSGAA